MIQQKKNTLTRSFSNVVGLAVNVRKKRPIKSNIPTMKSRIIDNLHFLFFVSANDPSEAMYTMITLSFLLVLIDLPRFSSFVREYSRSAKIRHKYLCRK